MTSKSTRSARSGKSLKPYPEFPLTAHPSGRWCKKCKPPGSDRTRTFYFGSIDDWEAALERDNREWPFIIQGKTPPEVGDPDEDACTVRTLCKTFLESKRNKIASGELRERRKPAGLSHRLGKRLAELPGPRRCEQPLWR